MQILKNSFETKQNEKFLFEKSMHVFQHDMIFAVAKVKDPLIVLILDQ